MPKRSFGEEGVSFVTCRHCGRAFKAVTAAHLVRRHRYDPDHPVREYIKRFGLPRGKCLDVIRRTRRAFARIMDREGRRWTKARVVREIRSRVRQERPIHAGAVQGRDGLSTTAGRLFGSWRAAVEAAGFDYSKVAQRYCYWSRREVVRRLRAEARAGRAMNHAAVQVRESSLHQAATRLFRSWDKALGAAGMNPDDIRLLRTWTKADLIRRIQELAWRLPAGRIGTHDRRLPSMGQALFGSWSAALRAAGAEYWSGRPRWRWTKRDILRTVRARARGGLSITASAVHASARGLYIAARREFGSWPAAVQAAGLTLP